LATAAEIFAQAQFFGPHRRLHRRSDETMMSGNAKTLAMQAAMPTDGVLATNRCVSSDRRRTTRAASLRSVVCGVVLGALLPGAAAAAAPRDPVASEIEDPFAVSAGATPTLAPASTDEIYQKWSAKRRKLQIQTGVSAGFAVALLGSGLLALLAPAMCRNPDPDFGCGEGLGAAIAAMTLLPGAVVATIPTIVFSVRLGRHNGQRPVAFQPGPGGFVLRF
jgi:hypothetical protein